MTTQLAFDFIEEIDEEQRQELEYLRRIQALKHERSTLTDIGDWHPPRPEEWDIILMGIRLARFVRDAECHECAFPSWNHCPDLLCGAQQSRYGSIYHVCIRDYFGKCVEWELLPPEYPEAHEQIKASIERARRFRHR